MSHNYYKDLCNELKYDLKRKKRDCEDLEDKLKREDIESKRLKNENHDLWKLYYGLQQELQSAYERNSKLQVEKMTIEGLYEREKHELEKLRSETSATNKNAVTLKEALCAMQSEKVALHHKFNEMMTENKKLKDREREVEPKLREFEEFKRRMNDFDQNLGKLIDYIIEQKTDLKEATIRKDQVETYRRYNAMLKQESEQKSRRLQQWPALVRALYSMEQKLTEAEARHATELLGMQQKFEHSEAWSRCARDTLPTFASQCQEMRAQVDAVRQMITDISADDADEHASSSSELVAQKIAEYVSVSDEERALLLAQQVAVQLSASNESLATCDEMFDDETEPKISKPEASVADQTVEDSFDITIIDEEDDVVFLSQTTHDVDDKPPAAKAPRLCVEVADVAPPSDTDDITATSTSSMMNTRSPSPCLTTPDANPVQEQISSTSATPV